MDEDKIIYLYCEKRYTLRMIADELGTNHNMIKRVLLRNGVEITQKDRIRKPFTEEHRNKISKSSKGRHCYWSGKHMPKDVLYVNMQTHIRWDVSVEFFMQFDDIDRLKELNHMLARNRVSDHFSTETYKNFILKFYYDDKFKKQYDIYKHTKNKYDRPSLDHILPLSRGGNWDLSNLQIISWFENRAKCDLTEDEFREMIDKYFKE